MDPATQCDHDVLIELRTEMRMIRQDIKELKDGLSTRVNDHESRIRSLETHVGDAIAERKGSDRATRLYGAILIFVVGVVEFFISHYYR